MVHDAEAHAEEDRQAAELAKTRNQCDALIHSVRHLLDEHGGSLSDDERKPIDEAMAAAEEALKGKDTAEMNAKAQTLAQAAAILHQKSAATSSEDGDGSESESSKKDDHVVDAEYKEVDDGKSG